MFSTKSKKNKNNLFFLKFILKGFLLFTILIPPFAFGSASQFWSQSVSGMGVGHADMAAGAYDASTAYYNPAGMMRLERPEILVGGVFASMDANVNYHVVPNVPAGSDLSGLTDLLDFSRSSPAHPGDDYLIPNFHAVYPIRKASLPDMAIGLSVVAPFGAKTNYEGTLASTYANQTKHESILINPSFAIRPYRGLSLGAGLDVQWLKSVYSSGLNLFGMGTNAVAEVDSWDVGWNVGALYEFSPTTRVGLTFRSKITHNQSGNLSVNSNLAFLGDVIPDLLPVHGSAPVTSQFITPATLSLGIYHDINKSFAMMVNAAYTFWDVVKDPSIQSDGSLNLLGFDIHKVDIYTNFDNTFFVSAGLTYKPTDVILLKAGLGYDQTPVRNEHREMRVPDADRAIASLGMGVEVNQHVFIDVAGQFIYTQKVSFNNPFLAIAPNEPVDIPGIGETTLGDLLRYEGDSKTLAYLFGAQVRYVF